MNKISGLNAALLVLLIAGASPALAERTNARATIWEGDDQFVTIVPIEEAAEPNQQPIQLGAETIAAALASVNVVKADATDTSPEGRPLLQLRAATQLAEHLSTALGQAGPQQDVVFAVTTAISTGLIGKEKVSVAARVFHREGRLHLLLGDVFLSTLPDNFHSDPNRIRQIDRRLYPHKPGTRKASGGHDYRVVADGNRASLKRSTSGERGDWVVFDLARLTPEPQSVRSGSSARTEAVGDGGDVLEQRLTRLKELLEAGLLDQQSYQNLVQEAVREDLFNR